MVLSYVVRGVRIAEVYLDATYTSGAVAVATCLSMTGKGWNDGNIKQRQQYILLAKVTPQKQTEIDKLKTSFETVCF